MFYFSLYVCSSTTIKNKLNVRSNIPVNYFKVIVVSFLLEICLERHKVLVHVYKRRRSMGV